MIGYNLSIFKIRDKTKIPIYLSIYLFMALQSFVEPWLLFPFLNLFTK
jgi:hypothetical protein